MTDKPTIPEATSPRCDHVHRAINAITEELCKKGIAKDNETKQGASFKFRGIDDVMNALAPLLAANRLNIAPVRMGRQITPFTTGEGKDAKTRFYVYVDVEYEFTSAEDGSRKVVQSLGEAMDSGDKATQKALSAAYKTACIQAFCIPTERDAEIMARELEEKRQKDVQEAEGRIAILMDTIHDADTYQSAREEVWPLVLQIKALDAKLAAGYEAKMGALKEKHAKRPVTVDGVLGGRR